MKKILSIALGGLAGYCVWIINYLDFAGQAASLVATPTIKSTSQLLVSALGNPVTAHQVMTSAILVLHSLPGAITVGAASALFLLKIPHSRLFFYSVLGWPILQICLGILMLTQLVKAGTITGNQQLAVSMYYFVENYNHRLFIMFSVYYITAFIFLALLIKFRRPKPVAPT